MDYILGETYWFKNELAGKNMQSGGQLIEIDYINELPPPTGSGL